MVSQSIFNLNILTIIEFWNRICFENWFYWSYDLYICLIQLVKVIGYLLDYQASMLFFSSRFWGSSVKRISQKWICSVVLGVECLRICDLVRLIFIVPLLRNCKNLKGPLVQFLLIFNPYIWRLNEMYWICIAYKNLLDFIFIILLDYK